MKWWLRIFAVSSLVGFGASSYLYWAGAQEYADTHDEPSFQDRWDIRVAGLAALGASVTQGILACRLYSTFKRDLEKVTNKAKELDESCKNFTGRNELHIL